MQNEHVARRWLALLAARMPAVPDRLAWPGAAVAIVTLSALLWGGIWLLAAAIIN